MAERDQLEPVRRAIRDVLSEGGPMGPMDDKQQGVLNVSAKPDMTIQSRVVEITKAAAYGKERIELLKKRDFPTHKSANAVGSAIETLDAIFDDMLEHPMSYLDADPEETVAAYEKALDVEEGNLSETMPAR